jgi:hypothetical protein
MHVIFVPLPYSGNFLSVHGNTSMAGYDSMSFFAVYGRAHGSSRDGKGW